MGGTTKLLPSYYRITTQLLRNYYQDHMMIILCYYDDRLNGYIADPWLRPPTMFVVAAELRRSTFGSSWQSPVTELRDET